MKITARFKNKKVTEVVSDKKDFILKKSKALKWEKSYLKVEYADRNLNEGIYEKRKEFELALRAFTE